MSGVRQRRHGPNPIGLALLAAAMSCATQSPGVRRVQEIGTVRQIYDGALFPDVQVRTFRNIDRLFATRVVKRGARIHPLPPSKRRLDALKFTSGGKTYDLYDYMSLNRIGGLLVLKDGEVAFESYQLGNDEHTRWMSMSIVKSMTACLVGAAIQDGFIAGIDDPVTRYLPQLRGSAYEGVSVRHLLNMASGVQWSETYTDPGSDRRRMLDLQIAQRPGAVLELMASLPRAAPPGTRWNYSTGETQVAAALVRAAVGRPLAEYLSDRIWARFGMEADATWWLEAPDGLEVGGSGLSATLRDYGRFGLFLLGDGFAGGERVLPEGWVREASSPKTVAGTPVPFGYMLWPIPDATGSFEEGAFEARGIFGQSLYVNPGARVVVVVWSARPKPTGMSTIDDYDFFAAVARELR